MKKKNEPVNFEGIVIPFSEAKLCSEITCDFIFVGDSCPRCGSKKYFILSKIIKK